MAGTPDTISSARLTSNILAARRVDNFQPAIRLLQDDKKNLMTMSGEISTRDTDNPLFKFLTTEMIPKTGTMGASVSGATASATSTGVNLSGQTTAVYLVQDDIIKWSSTGEIARVNATPANANSVDLVRNINAQASANIASGATWTKIGNARGENSRLFDTSSSLRALTTKEVSASNYTQTFRTALGLSRREMKSKLYGGADRPTQRMLKMLEHCEEIEHTFWHGVSAAEGDRTYCGGLLSFIPSGNSQVITVLTESEFDDFVRRITRYGNRAKRVFYCSRYLGQLISGWAKSSQRITSLGQSVKYGVSVDTYRTGTGCTIDVVYCDALEGLPGSSTLGTWDGYGVLVDPGALEKVTFGGDDLVFASDVQFKDQDGIVDAYLSDVGFDPGYPGKHGYITGVTS